MGPEGRRSRMGCLSRHDLDFRAAHGRLTTIAGQHTNRSARAQPAHVQREAPYLKPSESEAFVRSGQAKAKLRAEPSYLPPPTTRNLGFATTILAGSDQDICWAPVGRA